MQLEKLILQHFTAEQGIPWRESADSDRSLFISLFVFSTSQGCFQCWLKKIWLVVRGKGPINDDMKEQTGRFNLEILSKIALKEESVRHKGDVDKTYNLDFSSV